MSVVAPRKALFKTQVGPSSKVVPVQKAGRFGKGKERWWGQGGGVEGFKHCQPGKWAQKAGQGSLGEHKGLCLTSRGLHTVGGDCKARGQVGGAPKEERIVRCRGSEACSVTEAFAKHLCWSVIGNDTV